MTDRRHSGRRLSLSSRPRWRRGSRRRPAARQRTRPAGSILYLKSGKLGVASPDGRVKRRIRHRGRFESASQSDGGTIVALRGVDLHRLDRAGRPPEQAVHDRVPHEPAPAGIQRPVLAGDLAGREEGRVHVLVRRVPLRPDVHVHPHVAVHEHGVHLVEPLHRFAGAASSASSVSMRTRRGSTTGARSPRRSTSTTSPAT